MAPNLGWLKNLEDVDHYDLLGVDPHTGRLTLAELRRLARQTTGLIQRQGGTGPYTLIQINALRDFLNRSTEQPQYNANHQVANRSTGLTDRQLLDRFYYRYTVARQPVLLSWDPHNNRVPETPRTGADEDGPIVLSSGEEDSSSDVEMEETGPTGRAPPTGRAQPTGRAAPSGSARPTGRPPPTRPSGPSPSTRPSGRTPPPPPAAPTRRPGFNATGRTDAPPPYSPPPPAYTETRPAETRHTGSRRPETGPIPGPQFGGRTGASNLADSDNEEEANTTAHTGRTPSRRRPTGPESSTGRRWGVFGGSPGGTTGPFALSDDEEEDETTARTNATPSRRRLTGRNNLNNRPTGTPGNATRPRPNIPMPASFLTGWGAGLGGPATGTTTQPTPATGLGGPATGTTAQPTPGTGRPTAWVMPSPIRPTGRTAQSAPPQTAPTGPAHPAPTSTGPAAHNPFNTPTAPTAPPAPTGGTNPFAAPPAPPAATGPLAPAGLPAPPATPPTGPRQYTGPTNQSLQRLQILAGSSAGNRIAIGLVPRVVGGVPTGPPLLVVTAGLDSQGRLNYRVLGVDVNGRPVPGGAGRGNSLGWPGLQTRGLVLLGRFTGATVQEIRDFVEQFESLGPTGRLPLADRSPSYDRTGHSGSSYTGQGKGRKDRNNRSRSPSSGPPKLGRGRSPPAGGSGMGGGNRRSTAY